MTHTTFKDWPAMAAGLIPAIRELHKGAPGVMKAFREMGAAAHEGGAAQALEAYDQYTDHASG